MASRASVWVLLGCFVLGACQNTSGSSLYHTAQPLYRSTNPASMSSAANSSYSNSGTIIPGRLYWQGGMLCREFVQEVRHGARVDRTIGHACQHADGQWRVAERPYSVSGNNHVTINNSNLAPSRSNVTSRPSRFGDYNRSDGEVQAGHIFAGLLMLGVLGAMAGDGGEPPGSQNSLIWRCQNLEPSNPSHPGCIVCACD